MPDIVETISNFSTVDVTLAQNTETVVITTAPIPLPKRDCTVMITAWAQVTTGAGTTTITPRIRRGADASGALVGEATIEAIRSSATNTEPFFTSVQEVNSNQDYVQYTFTLTTASATATGTIRQAFIRVDVY